MTMPAAYSAIKGAIVNFSRYLAAYLGPQNIRVNTVSPGGIFDKQNPIFVENYEKKVPMRRMGFPDDISPSVAFLLSEDAKYITGQNLVIDGGWTAI
jgi:NAD(P)-dependent dehydrogenase (short-subunit alcohol dehydrogenase family)